MESFNKQYDNLGYDNKILYVILFSIQIVSYTLSLYVCLTVCPTDITILEHIDSILLNKYLKIRVPFDDGCAVTFHQVSRS